MRNLIKFFLYIDNKYIFALLILLLLLIFVAIFEVVGLSTIPILLSSILEQSFNLKFFNINFLADYLSKMNQNQKTINLSFFIIFFFLFKSLFLAFVMLLQGQIVKTIKINLSKKLFTFYAHQDYFSHISKNSSLTIRILSVDIGNSIIFILNSLNLTKDVLILSSIIFLLFLAHPEITSALFFCFSLLGLGFYYLNKEKLFQRGIKIQYMSSNLVKIIIESLLMFKEMKLYDVVNNQIKKYHSTISSSENNVFKNYFLIQLPKIFFEFFAVLVIISIVLYYSYSGVNLVSIMPFLSLFVLASLRLIPIFNSITTTLSALKVIQPSLNVIIAEFAKLKKIPLKTEYIFFKKNIILKDVSFNYPGSYKKIIENLNLTIERGDKLGIVGRSGCGKSTLINLILGLFKPTSGKIYLDGIEIDFKKNELLGNVGYVPQETNIIEDSVKNNIAFGIEENCISLDKLNLAIKSAQINDYIQNLKSGLLSIIGEKGHNLSVGQKQRLGVARALYKMPEIIIFDESTSALDSITEEKFINDIYKASDEKTIIFVSHKISALKKCNKIFNLSTKSFI